MLAKLRRVPIALLKSQYRISVMRKQLVLETEQVIIQQDNKTMLAKL